MKKIQCRLNFVYGVWADVVGRAGGVALLWSSEVDIHIRLIGQVWNEDRGTSIYG